MNRTSRLTRLFAASLLLAISTCAAGVESSAVAPNSDPIYLQLRTPRMATKSYEVNNARLVRDAGTFVLSSGTLCFLEPVQGVVTGAVFKGAGTFTIQTKDVQENRQLSLLTGQPEFVEDFDRVGLRFADGTAEQLISSGALKESAGACPVDVQDEGQKQLKKDLKENTAGRLLQPVMSGKPDGFFQAIIHGKKYSGKMLFVVDPRGIVSMEPEEVIMMTFDDMKYGIWYTGHLLSEVPGVTHEGRFAKPAQQKIDTTIEKSGMLNATATSTMTSLVDGLRVVPFNLQPKLRVSKVTDANGAPLSWIQEDKDEDGDFFVILPKALGKGESFSVTTTYGGKEVVTKEGDGNYYPTSRDRWYPNTQFGDYAVYELTFRIPKGLTMAATGSKVSERVEGNQSVTEWKSDAPMAVAGFNFGTFKVEEADLQKQGVKVAAFANKGDSDWFRAAKMAADMNTGSSDDFGALGTLDTTLMLKRALSEAQASVQLYTLFYGPMSYKHLQVTQQTAGFYGQAWPGLVFLPITYFIDGTARHSLGIDDTKAYFTTVEPHEIAHQWWGHTVGFNSYRDQWMSEGFSEFSAALFLQMARRDDKAYAKFWRDLRKQLLEKNKEGHRAIEVPLSMGYRASNSKAGYSIYRDLVYPKGAYVLQMLRMMMWDPKTRDQVFMSMMQDFVNSYRDKPASTQDFKKVVERHMLPVMNADGNGKMDWFFNQWVYGTELPTYSLEVMYDKNAEGKGVAKLTIKQSGVSANFKMPVPMYYELEDGRVARIGAVLLTGNQTQTVPVTVGDFRPKRFLLNNYFDILTTEQ